MLWVALLVPILYAVANIIDKFLIEKRINEPVVITILGGTVAFMVGCVMLAVKGFPFLTLTQTAVLLAAGSLFVLYLVPYYKALQIEEVSRVAPLFQLTPLVVLLFSFIFLQEHLVWKQYAGFFLVVIANLFISSGKVEGTLFKPRPALGFMVMVSFLYGLALVLLRYMVQINDIWVTMAYVYIGSGMGAAVLSYLFGFKKLMKYRNNIKQALPLVSLNIGLLLATQLLIGFVLIQIPAAILSITEGLSPLVVLIISIMLSQWLPHILKEDIGKQVVIKKLGSILVIIVGLYLVYF